jgi:hypothetical protein
MTATAVASAVTVAVCAVVLSACGGSSGSDCGDALAQPDGSQAYLSVEGDPVVRGELSCEELLALVQTIKENPSGPSLTAALKESGG